MVNKLFLTFIFVFEAGFVSVVLYLGPALFVILLLNLLFLNFGTLLVIILILILYLLGYMLRIYIFKRKYLVDKNGMSEVGVVEFFYFNSSIIFVFLLGNALILLDKQFFVRFGVVVQNGFFSYPVISALLSNIIEFFSFVGIVLGIIAVLFIFPVVMVLRSNKRILRFVGIVMLAFVISVLIISIYQQSLRSFLFNIFRENQNTLLNFRNLLTGPGFFYYLYLNLRGSDNFEKIIFWLRVYSRGFLRGL